MNRTPKPSPSSKQDGRNYVAGITIVGLTLGMALMMILIFNAFLSGGSINIPKFNLDLSLIIQLTALFIFLYFITAVGAFQLGKTYQWKIILKLAQRLYKRKLKPRKRRGKAVTSFSQRFNPQTASIKIPEESKLPFGSIKFEAGEKFLGPLFFPAWEARTFWSFGWSTLMFSIVLAVPTAILANLWPKAIWLVIPSIAIWFLVTVLRYLRKEWKRITWFFFITSERYGIGEGQWSNLGLLSGRGIDATITDTRATNIARVRTDPVPIEFGVSIDQFFELYLEALADTDQKVGSVYIEGVAGVGDLLLLHFQYAPWIATLLQQSPYLSKHLQTNLLRIDNTASQHEMGRPGQRNDYPTLKQEADAWKGQQHMRFGVNEPRTVDLWGMYLQYLESLAYPNRHPTTPPTTNQPLSRPLPGRQVISQPPSGSSSPSSTTNDEVDYDLTDPIL